MEYAHFISNKKLQVILHLLAWVIIIMLPRYIIHAYGNGDTGFLVPHYANTVVYGLFFYLNYLVLVPKLYFSNRKIWYFLVITVAILLLCLLLHLMNKHFFAFHGNRQRVDEIMDKVTRERGMTPPPMDQIRLTDYFYTGILISGFSFGLAIIGQLVQNEKARKDLEKEKLDSELAFLKSQVSPHFFFNTLNNIYSLIEINTEEAQQAVHKLSKLMRYLLYDSEHQTTKISDEIHFLHHYIDLMKLRLSSKVDLKVEIPEVYPNLDIPPLLFISFIENAFKHGLDYIDQSFIHLQMQIEPHLINFVISNSKGKTGNELDKKHSGIGLTNVKKRLELLFPNAYKLSINNSESTYTVNLTLNFKA